MKIRGVAVLAAMAAVVVAGCKTAPPKPPLVETVAVLPFDNESNDLNAPDIMQKYIYLALQRSPYRPIDIKTVNDKLASVGIVDGGQLAVVDPKKLGTDLGVQALLYGDVESFDYTNVGYYTSRKVTVSLKLVDVATGDTLWENSGTGANRQLTLDKNEATKNLVGGLAREAVEKTAKAPLDDESRQAAARALGTLPGYKFCGFGADSDLTKTQAGGRKALLDAIHK